MSLDPAYLEYPKRRRGMDQTLYEYSKLPDRTPVRWPDCATVAIACVISLEWFPMTPSDTPFRAPGHMQTAYPDYRHYTAREYGTRVGFYRLLDAIPSLRLEFMAQTTERRSQPLQEGSDSGKVAGNGDR